MLSEKTPRWWREIGEVPFVRRDAAAALPLCYLGSLCVSPDDVNLSSSGPQRRSLGASGGEHAPAHLQVKNKKQTKKNVKGNINPKKYLKDLRYISVMMSATS